MLLQAKDTLKSITIRVRSPMALPCSILSSLCTQSVLSEVYAADKATSGPASPSTVVGILRKATARRVSAALAM